MESNQSIYIAWASKNNLALGQVKLKVKDKSNEITAIPNLIESPAIKDAVITIETMVFKNQ